MEEDRMEADKNLLQSCMAGVWRKASKYSQWQWMTALWILLVWVVGGVRRAASMFLPAVEVRYSSEMRERGQTGKVGTSRAVMGQGTRAVCKCTARSA